MIFISAINFDQSTTDVIEWLLFYKQDIVT